MDEDFDSLREKSARTSSVYDDIEGGEDEERSGGLLLFIDIVALACAVLVFTGQIF
jgi:hypothetical protein